MSLPIETNSISSTVSTEISNIFPSGKLNGRSVSHQSEQEVYINFSSLCGLVIGTLGLVALGLYQYNRQQNQQDLYEFLDNQANYGQFEGITQSQMESHYGLNKRSLTALEGRELYKKINKFNLGLAEKALANNGHADLIASNACKTRHAARLFVRELTPEIYHKDAEYRDLLVYGVKTGLNCNQIIEKYNRDSAKIIAAAGRPNSDVNWFVETMPESWYSSIPECVRHAFINLGT